MKVLDKIIFDAEISERKILRVPVNTIIATPYNPTERTDDGKKLRKLAETVKQYGIIQRSSSQPTAIWSMATEGWQRQNWRVLRTLTASFSDQQLRKIWSLET